MTRGQLQPALGQEWLLTNGTGGFASGTVVGCNTRRYHGLLCAATLPPVGRMMMLSRIGEIITFDGRSDRPHETSISQFGNNFHPRGDRYLTEFQLGSTAVWTYDVEGATLTKELKLLHGRSVAAVRYTLQTARAESATLSLLPFLAVRDFHTLRRGSGPCFNVSQTSPQQIVVRDGHNAVYLRGMAGDFRFVPQTDWWFGQTYPLETERGQDDTEDLFTPGRFVTWTDANGRAQITIWASLDSLDKPNWDDAANNARASALEAQARHVSAGTRTTSQTVRRLLRAADDFVVRRRGANGVWGTTIIAGYPWFSDWGRDTMISLPGLLLTPGRFDEAKSVLEIFAHYVSEGMIPNRFDDYTNEPTYNTVDASLWFVHACYEYLKCSKDDQTFTRTLLPACRAVIEGYKAGTRYGIRMDPRDGLITQGDAHTQLTWMDAQCGEVVFTPRHGKAVEINALWYHVLRLSGEDALADKVEQAFTETFWIDGVKGLADVVSDDGRRDESIRPNQIMAVSLPHSALSREHQRAVVDVVRRELLTPVGLRTLATSDPGFRAKYTGPQWLRDQAYHNGAIWPWLMGAFLDAYLRVHDHDSASVDQARRWLSPLIDQLEQGCIGSLNEIYEADPPHRPVGAYAQAWSVAEVLRLAVILRM